ncbi:MAG: hypothetical protein ACLTYN_08270 [Dysosmobacter welbionis]
MDPAEGRWLLSPMIFHIAWAELIAARRATETWLILRRPGFIWRSITPAGGLCHGKDLLF